MAVIALALGFAAYTRHAWEDYYITFRASRNLALGHGLVYTPGERVHAFTSPVNVLLPALFDAATGCDSDELVLWLFRVSSALLLGVTAYLLLRIARATHLGSWATFTLLALFGLSPKIIDFSVNGQEAAFMVAAVALCLYVHTTPVRRPALILGIAWAGLMWTRPDGFVYVGFLAIGFFLWPGERLSGSSRRALLALYGRAAIVATVLYAPWVLWAWQYYGTPVPHTITAKGVHLQDLSPIVLLKKLVLFPLAIFATDTSVDRTLTTVYSGFEGWPSALVNYSRLISIPCALYWVLPFGRPHARSASFAFLGVHFYLTHFVRLVMPWYYPGAIVLCLFVLAQALQQGLNSIRLLGTVGARDTRLRRTGLFLKTVAVAVVSTSLAMTLAGAYQLRIQQAVIEEGNRKVIGLWLRDHADSPKDTVMLECLGYIGYFSQLKMLDYPGLSSPEMVSARKELGTDDFTRLVPRLRPTWLVLRDENAEQIQRDAPDLLRDQYVLAKTFDVRRRVLSYTFLPGRGYLLFDALFHVYRRRASPTMESRPPR